MVPGSEWSWIAVNSKIQRQKYESLRSGTFFTFLEIFENFDLR